MKKLLLLLILLCPAIGIGQTLDDVNIVRNGYWQVVSPDTITNHTAQYQAIERQINLLLQGVPENQITIKPPLFEVRATYRDVAPDTVCMPADTVFLGGIQDTLKYYEVRNLYPVEFSADTVDAIYYDLDESVRNIRWALMDSTQNDSTFWVRAYGKSNAESIKYASKCIGYDSTMTAIDQRVSMPTFQPDSLGGFDQTSPPYYCNPQGGNAMMTIWFTATMANQSEVTRRVNIDVAHARSIGNQP